MIQAALDRITLLPAPRLFWARIAQPITKSTERADQRAARTWSTLVSGGTHTTRMKGVGKGKPLAFLLPCKQGFAESWLRAVRGNRQHCVPHSDKAQGWGEPFILGKRKLLKHITIERDCSSLPRSENNWIIKAAWTLILHLSHILDLYILLYMMKKSPQIYFQYTRGLNHT